MIRKTFIVVIGSFILSCSKGPPPEYNLVVRSLKTDFNFKKGSFWIMKDSVSGRLDSFFVADYTDTTSQMTGGISYPSVITESIDISILELNTSMSLADSLYWYYSYRGNQVSLHCSEDKILNGIVSFTPFFLYPVT